MASRGLRDKVAIVGMGCTAFGERFESGVDELVIEAATAAAQSAGIALGDVDAFWVGTAASGLSGLTVSRPLKLDFKPVTRVENFCATGSEALRNACYAVACGAYDVAMAIGVEKLKDEGLSGLPASWPPGDGTRSALTPPALFSLIVPAYAAKYGVGEDVVRDVLTHIAWKNHRNGARNPRAQFQREVSREEISNAPVVAGSLRLYDCSGVADGAAAAVVVRAEEARRYQEKPLYLKALSLVASPGGGSMDPSYDYTTFPEVVAAAEDAYRQAGIEDPRAQLALVELHDCFTPTELVLLEDLGLAQRGGAWKEVLEGAFDLEGDLPVNPDGGLKSFGHPVGASGLRMLFECFLQLRKEAGARQVRNDRRLALTQNLGGTPGEAVTFVSIVGVDADGTGG